MIVQRAEVLDSAYARDRAFMVERHLAARGVGDPLVLDAMGEVPREAFVSEHSRSSLTRTRHSLSRRGRPSPSLISSRA